MNPHLHRHLYSDLPGYKLGRSSGILSRGFHGKLWLLKLLSPPPPFFPLYLWWQVKSYDYLLLLKRMGPLHLSVHDVSFKKKREKPVVGILAEGTIWRVTGELALEARDHERGAFKQLKGEGKLIILCGLRFDFSLYIQNTVIS